MREMSSRHGTHAVDQRHGGDSLGPHAIAFLYHDQVQRPGVAVQDVVRAATRLFRDGPDVRDLPALLHGLATASSEYADRGGFDPRTVMSHRTDDMSPNARFIGVGVSTLDTRAGDWVDIGKHTDSALQVPGCVYLTLTDDTRIILERGGPFGVNGSLWSSQKLELNQTMASYGSWKSLQRDPNDPTEAVWAGLDMLLAQLHRGMRSATTAHRRR